MLDQFSAHTYHKWIQVLEYPNMFLNYLMYLDHLFKVTCTEKCNGTVELSYCTTVDEQGKYAVLKTPWFTTLLPTCQYHWLKLFCPAKKWMVLSINSLSTLNFPDLKDITLTTLLVYGFSERYFGVVHCWNWSIVDWLNVKLRSG